MAAALEAKIEALSAAQARERRFTADVAHELRTPLTALVGEASLLAEHLDRMPPESRRPAELLIADVGRLRTLVEELMEISRFDAGAESVHAETVDLGSLTAATVRARGWDGRVRLEARRPCVTSDPRRLERIVANLVGNALEHGGDDGVRSGSARRQTFVEVADHGPGIAPRAPAAPLRALLQGGPVPQPAAAPASASRSRRRTRVCSAARSRSGASPARAPLHAVRLWQNRYAAVTATVAREKQDGRASNKKEPP